MTEAYAGHIDRQAFERALREAFGSIPADVITNPSLACQARGTEVSVQFALFIADELNAGTSADVLLDAGCRIIGNMVENFARGFAGDEGENIDYGPTRRRGSPRPSSAATWNPSSRPAAPTATP
jgi:hypothetical protein